MNICCNASAGDLASPDWNCNEFQNRSLQLRLEQCRETVTSFMFAAMAQKLKTGERGWLA